MEHELKEKKNGAPKKEKERETDNRSRKEREVPEKIDAAVVKVSDVK